MTATGEGTAVAVRRALETPAMRDRVRSSLSSARWITMAIGGWLVVAAGGAARPEPAEDPRPVIEEVPAGAPAGATPGEATPLPRPVFTAKGTELCVRCHRSEQGDWVDESTTKSWRHDAHSRAHLALSSDNDRTRAMEQALGITAARTAACVACHTHPADEPTLEEETDIAHGGISCETCHGAGSGYFEPHMEKRWRFLSTAEKESLGMHDLRNPVRKAENCLGCHLGDVPSGRFVTHAMYAAGHPPLPAFEMESFGTALGPHWKRLWEKSSRVQAAAVAAGYDTEAAGDLQRSLIGGLTAVRRTAALVQDYAERVGDPPRTAVWPELAVYDCQACHHELRVPSWRQEVGPGGLVPGRPSLVRWPRGLAAVGMAQAGLATDVDALLGAFRDALDVRPFGAPAQVRNATVEPLARIDGAIAILLAVRRDEGLAAREHEIVLALAAAGQHVGDFESARQLAWPLAAAVIRDEAWPVETRDAIVRRLTTTLGLEFPQPPYPEPSSRERPFWRSSLTAAAAADMDRIHEAFQLPPAPR